MKTRTHHHASRNGRPGEWTCDDLEAARLEANETARPKGEKGPTPDEAWSARKPITDEDRDVFAATVRKRQALHRKLKRFRPFEKLS